jgi:hypothetical protein
MFSKDVISSYSSRVLAYTHETIAVLCVETIASGPVDWLVNILLTPSKEEALPSN